MTQEDKKLLLKDLCARLLYGVNVLADIDKTFDGGCIGIINKIEPYVGDKFPELKGQYLLYQKGCLTPLVVDEVRPYLRPMSSMTEEEMNELCSPAIDMEMDFLSSPNTERPTPLGIKSSAYQIDYCLAHHLDFRGLILMGLALEALEGMYKTE